MWNEGASRARKLGRIVASCALFLAFLVGLWWCRRAVSALFVDAVNDNLVFHWTMLTAGIALCGLVGSSVLLKRPAAENVATMAIATLAAAYFLEGVLWALNIKPGDHFNRMERRGTPVDHRTAWQVAADMRTAGGQAVPLFPPSWHVASSAETGSKLFPLSAVSRAFTVLCNEDGQFSAYTSDERGFMNPAGLWSRRPPFDIAIVGDSFTNGVCVAPGEDIASHIRRRFPLTMSLGMAGNGPLIELASIKEYVPALRPKLVLWFYYDNDLDDLKRELTDPRLRRYLDPTHSQNLADRQGEIDAFLTGLLDAKVKELKDHRPTKESASGDALRLKRVRRLMESSIKTYPIESPVHDEATLDAYVRIVDTANKLVARAGGRLILVYVPDWTRVKDRPSDPGYRQKDVILAAALRARIPVIDTLDALRLRPDAATAYYHYPGSHFNKQGYRIVAEYVLDRLEARTRSEPGS